MTTRAYIEEYTQQISHCRFPGTIQNHRLMPLNLKISSRINLFLYVSIIVYRRGFTSRFYSFYTILLNYVKKSLNLSYIYLLRSPRFFDTPLVIEIYTIMMRYYINYMLQQAITTIGLDEAIIHFDNCKRFDIYVTVVPTWNYMQVKVWMVHGSLARFREWR